MVVAVILYIKLIHQPRQRRRRQEERERAARNLTPRDNPAYAVDTDVRSATPVNHVPVGTVPVPPTYTVAVRDRDTRGAVGGTSMDDDVKKKGLSPPSYTYAIRESKDRPDVNTVLDNQQASAPPYSTDINQ